MQHLYKSLGDFIAWWDEYRTRELPLVWAGPELLLLPGDADGTPLRVRLPLILQRPDVDGLEALADELAFPKAYALILLQAGRASLAIAEADKIIVSKQIQKYMVRKSQGKAQLTYLNRKGKSRLGSRIRLRQTEAFFDEINAYLSDWTRRFELKALFLSCTPRLKGAWFQSSPPWEKKDERWQLIPFQVYPPKEEEMHRIHRLLCRASFESSDDRDFSLT